MGYKDPTCYSERGPLHYYTGQCKPTPKDHLLQKQSPDDRLNNLRKSFIQMFQYTTIRSLKTLLENRERVFLRQDAQLLQDFGQFHMSP